MKKIIAVLMAIALTSFASAATAQLELVSGTIGAGNTITLAIVADVPVSSVSISGLWDNNAGGTCGETFGNHATIPAAASPAITVVNYNGFVNKGYMAVSGFWTSAGATVAANTNLVWFDYTIPSTWGGSSYDVVLLNTGDLFYADMGEGEMGFELEADSSCTTTGAVQVSIDGYTITPEPMTMSLLAIGGLVALRRRRA